MSVKIEVQDNQHEVDKQEKHKKVPILSDGRWELDDISDKFMS